MRFLLVPSVGSVSPADVVCHLGEGSGWLKRFSRVFYTEISALLIYDFPLLHYYYGYFNIALLVATRCCCWSLLYIARIVHIGLLSMYCFWNVVYKGERDENHVYSVVYRRCCYFSKEEEERIVACDFIVFPFLEEKMQ